MTDIGQWLDASGLGRYRQPRSSRLRSGCIRFSFAPTRRFSPPMTDRLKGESSP